MFNENDFKNAIEELIKQGKYNVETLQWAERIYRMETSHFKSVQYQVCGAPGMESHGTTYPYGWSTMQQLNIYPTSTLAIKEGKGVQNDGGKMKKFLTFRSVIDPLNILCTYIEKYNNPMRWYSKDPVAQEKYKVTLLKIRVRYV